ncbi:hypothetical protein HPU229334_08305 [Helicobacter pullorum]|uniref:Uncharacterized protein n=1 Tax=Helicobacter pullorum TaxID=35818 RepID=A0A0N0LTN7_9HELI|nr:hypothetical protein HPU229334_08305 [Helicobacter pullorum]OCR08663.1 hypothetical protein A7X13_07145 [Helicobacter pullorum]
MKSQKDNKLELIKVFLQPLFVSLLSIIAYAYIQWQDMTSSERQIVISTVLCLAVVIYVIAYCYIAINKKEQ